MNNDWKFPESWFRPHTAILMGLCLFLGCGGGGLVRGGGQSGTGLTSIRGNIVDITSSTADVSGIRVSIADSDIEDFTNSTGEFELGGEFAGEAQLRFERDTLLGETTVIVPSGGVLELRDVVIDTEDGEVTPTSQHIELEGFVDALDCTHDTLVVLDTDDRAGTMFTIALQSALILRGETPLACTDLRVGDRVEVDAATADGRILEDATIRVEDREDEEDPKPNATPGDDGPGQEVEIEGFVHTLECDSARMVVRRKEGTLLVTIDTTSASIHQSGNTLTCSDLIIDDRVHAKGTLRDGLILDDVKIEVEDREDEPDEEDENDETN